LPGRRRIATVSLPNGASATNRRRRRSRQLADATRRSNAPRTKRTTPTPLNAAVRI
jgi:hypothetical protein